MASTVSRSLAGKVAIVTGAATGIGRASALLFGRAGASVVLADVRRAELEVATVEVREVGGEHTAVMADLARPEDCAAVVAAAIAAHGRLDVLFNNADVGCGTAKCRPRDRGPRVAATAPASAGPPHRAAARALTGWIDPVYAAPPPTRPST